MKFGKFMSDTKINNFIKNSAKTAVGKVVPCPFVFAKS